MKKLKIKNECILSLVGIIQFILLSFILLSCNKELIRDFNDINAIEDNRDLECEAGFYISGGQCIANNVVKKLYVENADGTWTHCPDHMAATGFKRYFKLNDNDIDWRVACIQCTGVQISGSVRKQVPLDYDTEETAGSNNWGTWSYCPDGMGVMGVRRYNNVVNDRYDWRVGYMECAPMKLDTTRVEIKKLEIDPDETPTALPNNEDMYICNTPNWGKWTYCPEGMVATGFKRYYKTNEGSDLRVAEVRCTGVK